MKLTCHELREVIDSILCTWGSTKGLHETPLWEYLVKSLKNGRHSTDLNWRGIGILQLSGYIVYKEGIAARKKENNRGSGSTPSYSFPWNPFPFSRFVFLHLLQLPLEGKLALCMLCTPFLCLENFPRLPTSQQRLVQCFLTSFESQTPSTLLNSKKKVIHSSEVNPWTMSHNPRWEQSEWQGGRRVMLSIQFLFPSTFLHRVVLGPFPHLLKMSESRPTDKVWRYKGINSKNKT